MNDVAPSPTHSGPPTAASALSKMTTAVKRACDACHRRKVKCDGVNPCRNCSSAQLTCTYHAIPQKKGPKGSRAKVISELRETQRHTTLTSKAGAGNGTASSVASQRLHGTSNLVPTPGLLTPEMMKECLDFFFAHLYSKLPILDRSRVESRLTGVEHNADAYCLVASLCAFTLLQPGMSTPGDPMGIDTMPGANLMTSTILVEETLRVRKNFDHTEAPSLNTLCTSYFLFACFHALDLHNKAWYHLREATTLALIMGMQKEESYMQCDVVEASRRRRLYWLLFVAERAYALQRQRPTSLSASIALPNLNDDPAESRLDNLQDFFNLASLYHPFDDGLISLWNKTRNDCSPSYIAALQKQLSEAVPGYLGSHSDGAVGDLQASQQWLRTMVWQLNMQNNGEESVQFQYPDLMAMTSQFSQQNMGSQGASLIEKLLSTSCSLTEYLAALPSASNPFTSPQGPREYLHQFQTLLSILRSGDTRFLPLLLTKVHDVLPLLSNPMLQSVPEGLGNPAAEIDIFDGFGNAGMAMPPQSSFPSLAIPSPQGHQDFKMEDHLMTPSVASENGQAHNSAPHVAAVQQMQHTQQHPQHIQSPTYASPPHTTSSGMISTPLEMEFPNLSEYANPPEHHGYPHSGGGGSAGHDFKQEFDMDALAAMRRVPLVRHQSAHAHPHGHGYSQPHASHGMDMSMGMGTAMAGMGVHSMGQMHTLPATSVPDYTQGHPTAHGHMHNPTIPQHMPMRSNSGPPLDYMSMEVFS